jgi:hypothetical protein
MHKLNLHWTFFKSSLVFNLSTSAFLAAILKMVLALKDSSPPIYVLYIYSFMFGGPLFDFFYKDLNHNDEFYFYHNRAISKYSLLISSMLFAITFGVVLLTIIHYAKPA